MTLNGMLARYTVAYIALSALVMAGLSLLDVGFKTSLNVAALLGAVTWACLSFSKRNQRFLTKSEKTLAVIGMVGIDVALQLAIYLNLAAHSGQPLSWGAAATGVLVMGSMHAMVIYVFVGFLGQRLAKRAPTETPSD